MFIHQLVLNLEFKPTASTLCPSTPPAERIQHIESNTL